MTDIEYGADFFDALGNLSASTRLPNLHKAKKLTKSDSTRRIVRTNQFSTMPNDVYRHSWSSGSITDFTVDGNQTYSYAGGFQCREYSFLMPNDVIPLVGIELPVDGITYALTSYNKGVTGLTQTRWSILINWTNATSDAPDIYIFSDPNHLTGTSGYGIQTFGADGKKYFDSTVQPLAINQAGTVSLPTVPYLTWPGTSWVQHQDNDTKEGPYAGENWPHPNPVAWTHNEFIPNRFTIISPTPVTNGNPVVFFPSNASTNVNTRHTHLKFEDPKVGSDKYDTYSRDYYVGYRGGMNRQYNAATGQNEIRAGWVPSFIGGTDWFFHYFDAYEPDAYYPAQLSWVNQTHNHENITYFVADSQYYTGNYN